MNTTQPPLAHHTFNPWAVDGDRRIVAAEHEWDEMLKIDEEARLRECRTRVMVSVDVFEDWRGEFYHDDEWVWMVHTRDGALWTTQTHYSPDPDNGVDRYLVTQDVRQRLFRIIDSTPNLDWLLVTSRPENVERMTPDFRCGRKSIDAIYKGLKVRRSNIWLGVRVSNQAEADERIPQLLRVPAAVRFVMCELTGAVDFSRHMSYWIKKPCPSHSRFALECAACNGKNSTRVNNIHWVIVSGESGFDARPMHPDWVRSIRDQCNAAGVPFWFDGWGDWYPLPQPEKKQTEADVCNDWPREELVSPAFACVGKERSGRLLDGRTWDEVPNQNQEPQS